MKRVLYFLTITSSLLLAKQANIENINSTLNTSNPLSKQKEFEVTLNFLEKTPKSFTKDFYIIQYLKQDISPNEALKALSFAKNVNKKMFYLFAKKFKHDETIAVAQCMQANTSELLQTYDDCIKVGLNLYKATKIAPSELKDVALKLKEKYPDFSKQLNIISAAIPFTKLIISSKDTFYDVFLNVGSKFRENYFNYKLPKSTFKKIFNDKRFNKFIKLVVQNPSLNLLQKSLLELDTTNLNAQSLFYLALNSINHNNLNKAFEYLNKSYEKENSKFHKQKITFWKYLITLDKEYLLKLASSNSLNIYTIYAKELTKRPIYNLIYDISLKPNEKNISYNIEDNFQWIEVLKDLKKLEKIKLVEKYEAIFNTNETKAHLAFILNKYYNYTKHYFLTPYEEELKDVGINRKALIYAIARQESRFIPSSISPALAQGTMQIMPFLSKEIANNINDKDYNIYKMFDYKTNLKYANYHLNYLKAKVKHPLFIAYSYNGGLGYFNSLKRNLFKNITAYEPFMSMELVSYDETRLYGKKVLANYYIYKNFLDKEHPTSITTIFDNLYSLY